MTKLERLDAKVDAAWVALDAEINRQFPVGTADSHYDGRGRMRGTVAYKCWHGRLRIQSRTGYMHHKHWSDVRLDDGWEDS